MVQVEFEWYLDFRDWKSGAVVRPSDDILTPMQVYILLNLDLIWLYYLSGFVGPECFPELST